MRTVLCRSCGREVMPTTGMTPGTQVEYCSDLCRERAAQRAAIRALEEQEFEEAQLRLVARALAKCNVAPPELQGAYAPLGERLAAPLAKRVWAALKSASNNAMGDDQWSDAFRELEGDHP